MVLWAEALPGDPTGLIAPSLFFETKANAASQSALSLTCPTSGPNITTRHDRADHLALPHHRETGWWRDGCGVQSRGYAAAPFRRAEVPARRFSTRPSGSQPFSARS